jgi:hypothetical protein
VEVFANDQDGDPIDYSVVNGPEGAEIITEGNSTFFRWTPAEGTSDTTITVRVNDPISPTLSNTTQFDVVIEEPDTSSPTEDPPFSPTNDSNNSNPVDTGDTTSTASYGAEFIADSTVAELSDAEAEIIRDSVHAAEDRDASQLESDSNGYDDTGEEGSEYLASSEAAAMDADVAEMQRLIIASTPEAQVAEILSILEQATNLIGCGR